MPIALDTVRRMLAFGYRHLPQRLATKLVPAIFCKLPHDLPSTIIQCVGDSHVSLFSGKDEIPPVWPDSSMIWNNVFKIYRLGPVLANNLDRRYTKTRGRERLFTLLINHIVPGSRVLLCFGEIDCRAHLIKRSIIENLSLEAIVAKSSRRYFSVVREIIRLGYRPMIWNVIPSICEVIGPANAYPTYGSISLRNHVTFLFNRALRDHCDKERVDFISIDSQLIGQDGLPNRYYYMDSIHLSSRALPLAIQAIDATRRMPNSSSSVDRLSDP